MRRLRTRTCGHYLWRERKLPMNVDPFDARLEDEVERERLRRVFTQGLDAIVGYALPIRRLGGREGSWATGRWFLRDERLYLFPGDSPMGLRLPLDSLPWSHPDDLLTVGELDPFAPRAPLAAAGQRDDPRPAGLRSGAHGVHDPAEQSRLGAGEASGAESVTGRHPSRGESAAGVVRSALCVEPRGGVLYIFMPPVKELEDYLDLVSAIEETAGSLGDARAARRLSAAERPAVAAFQRHAGSGCHRSKRAAGLRLGCARRADDDTLRRCETRGSRRRRSSCSTVATPERVAAIISCSAARHRQTARSFGDPTCCEASSAYWHNHPSLSYLFSGLFLGPTSQAPRIDEGRHDSLYELEIAFSRFAPQDTPASPWFVDRALRHLLVDVTGNTHRAEFCIDKLYSPDLSSGRRGLLEMRAFEMPPDARMSVAQQLLLRALIARFWREPYTTV